MGFVKFDGEPGTTWTNETGKAAYQWHCSLDNTCGACFQLHMTIANVFPQLHRGCNCTVVLLLPGDTSAEFVDFRSVLAGLGHDQQVAAVGASNYRLIEQGVVTWEDVVTPTRVRDLREVVAREKLSVQALADAGVRPDIAERAFATVHTPAHQLAAEARAELVAQLQSKGVELAETRQAVAERLAARVSIGAGPSERPPGWEGGIGIGGGPKPPVPPPLPPAVVSERLGVKLKPLPPAAPPPVEVKKVKEFGLAKVPVKINAQQRPNVEKRVKELFGRKLTDAELASIAGAPDSASEAVVTIDPYHFGSDPPLIVNWSIPKASSALESRAMRTFRFDPTLGGLVVHNDVCKLLKEHQGGGVGQEMFGRQVETLAKLGVKEIEINAFRSGTEWVGYKVWPKFGYDGAIPSRVAAKLPNDLKSAKTVQDLYRTKKGQDWWETNGDSFDATFDLAANSPHRQRWERYLERKAAARPPP